MSGTIEWLTVSIILANVRYYRVADSEYNTSLMSGTIEWLTVSIILA